MRSLFDTLYSVYPLSATSITKGVLFSHQLCATDCSLQFSFNPVPSIVWWCKSLELPIAASRWGLWPIFLNHHHHHHQFQKYELKISSWAETPSKQHLLTITDVCLIFSLILQRNWRIRNLFLEWHNCDNIEPRIEHTYLNACVPITSYLFSFKLQ